MTSVIYCGDTWTPTQLRAKLKNGPNVCALISSPSLSSGFLSSLPPTPQEESLTYQGHLDKLQADILKARDESFNIQLKAQEAEFARDQAKVSHGRRLCNKSTLCTTCTLLAVTSKEWFTRRCCRHLSLGLSESRAEWLLTLSRVNTNTFTCLISANCANSCVSARKHSSLLLIEGFITFLI